VTAHDVKWSFDRAVSVGGFPTFQMSAGSLEKPDQFVAVDDQTFRVDFVRKDKMLMFNLAVVVPFVINSALAKKNATAADPWAMAWLRNNEAGGGAYRVESWRPGSETILARFDNWKSGPLPKIRRVIARDVPSPGTRRAMLERGDADISTGFPPKDFDQMIKEGKVRSSACRSRTRSGTSRSTPRARRSTTSSCVRRSPGRCRTSRSRRARSSAAPSRCMAAERPWSRRHGRSPRPTAPISSAPRR
jgi:ABC-type transport system substrate-binding protein